MILTNKLDLIFVKKESAVRQLATFAGGDAVLVVADPMADQLTTWLKDMQRRNTLSALSPVQARFPEGNFEFEAYQKPSGSAGTAGVPDQCNEGVYGVRTVNAGVSVVYSEIGAGVTPPTYSMALRKGDFTFYNLGCVFGKKETAIKADTSQASITSSKYTGQFMKQIVAGKTTLNGAISSTSATTFVVATGTAKFFDVGAPIDIGTATGKIISAVDYGTDTITISTAIGSTQLDGATVKGSLPAVSESGYIINSYLGTPTLDGASFPFVDGSIIHEVPIKIHTDEKNGEAYASDFSYGLDDRMVTITLNKYFKSADHARWYQSRIGTQFHLIIPFGTTAGKIITYDFPHAQLMKTPKISSNPLTLALEFQSFASTSYDDEDTETWS